MNRETETIILLRLILLENSQDHYVTRALAQDDYKDDGRGAA